MDYHIGIELSTAAGVAGGHRTPRSVTLRYMDYLDAVEQACELAAEADPAAVQSALQLAILAWKALAGADPGWDLFGLEVLAVADEVDPKRQIVVFADPPGADGPHLRAALRRLVDTIATRLELTAGDEQRELLARLDQSAAAAQLRHALAALP